MRCAYHHVLAGLLLYLLLPILRKPSLLNFQTTILLSLFSFLYLGTFFLLVDTASEARVALVAPFLVWVSIEDIKTFTVPDLAIFFLAACGMLKLLAFSEGDLVIDLGIAVGLALLLFFVGEVIFRVTSRDGLGIGDTKLFAAGALWLGADKLLDLLFVSSLLGVIVTLLLRSAKRHVGAEIPFAPYIAYSIFLLSMVEPILVEVT